MILMKWHIVKLRESAVLDLDNAPRWKALIKIKMEICIIRCSLALFIKGRIGEEIANLHFGLI